MIQSILKWFKTPYFFNSSSKTQSLLGFGLGFFVFLFILIFEPFGIVKLDINVLNYAIGFGMISFLIHMFSFIVIPRIFKKIFKNENWNVGKNILFLFLVCFSISIGNWYFNSIFRGESTTKTLLDFILYTAAISIFPITILTYFLESSQRKQTRKKSNYHVIKPVISLSNKEIKIYGDNKKEELSFNLDELIYISSEGNYATFFLNSNKGVKEYILRNSLTNIMADLNKFNSIVRCHKSYIINAVFMNAISGNSKGYYFECELIKNKIPVSRQFRKEELIKLIE